MNVLMVCLGNICRSPMADGLLRMKFKQHGIEGTVDSAGTANYHIGKAPDHRMRATAKSLGYPIDELRARQFKVNDFDQFDLIYAMDNSNRDNMLQLARNDEDMKKVRLILDELPGNEGEAVPDPYYGTQHDFEHVFHLLDRATNQIITNIKHHDNR